MAMAEVPGRLEKLFVDQSNEISANGVYAFNFHALGMPTSVVIDDYLPFSDHSNMIYYVGEENRL